MVGLEYQEVAMEHDASIFENIEFLEEVDLCLLLFSHLCVYHYAECPSCMNKIQEEDGLVYTKLINTNNNGSVIFFKFQNSIFHEDKLAGAITIGDDNQPICVPSNTTITLLGETSELATKRLYTPELATHNNFPAGAVANRGYRMPRLGQVSVILINTNSRNIWIQQSL